jgi:putative membrane protein
MYNYWDMKLISKLIISTISIFVASYIVPGVHVPDILTAVIVAIVLGILNLILKPILVLLTLPVTILTLGLFYFVINALIILLASKVVPGFVVDSFLSALLFSLVLSLIHSFLNSLLD